MSAGAAATDHGVVLVVDDDPAVREAVMDVLAEEGYRVAGAADGQEALERLLAGDVPCLVLLDLTMPRLSGWQVLDQLAADPALSSIPVVVLTGASQAQLTSVTVPAVLRKPVDVDKLLATVETYC